MKEKGLELSMERDYGMEIDALKEQMENLQKTIASQMDQVSRMLQETLSGRYYDGEPDKCCSKEPSKDSDRESGKCSDKDSDGALGKCSDKDSDRNSDKHSNKEHRKCTGRDLGRVQFMQGMHPDKRLSDLMEELCYKTQEGGGSGLITYLGIYTTSSRQSNWIRNSVPTEDLLSLAESGIVGRVLACIGNTTRLSILLEILRGPKTVSALVEKCGFSSTGQVYHHMKPLLAADLITENERQKGTYVIQSNRVQGIIMLLAGISDMVDETYTQGNWDDEIYSDTKSED